MVAGKVALPVSGSKAQSKPTDIFTIAKMIYGVA